MTKKKEEMRNMTAEVFFSDPVGNLPGVDMSKVIQVYPVVIREDGYVPPTEPMTKRKWWFLYYISFFIPIRRYGKKYDPFYKCK
jgi:hypothetical protein